MIFIALVHDFIVLSNRDNMSLNDIQRNKKGLIDTKKSRIEDYVWIEDSLFLYMQDSFKWIPTGYNEKGFGFNYDGLTYINHEGATVFRNVVESWISLFSNAPERFILRGLYSEDHETGVGDYIRDEYIKIHVLEKLERLKRYIKKIEEDTNLHILHLGI